MDTLHEPIKKSLDNAHDANDQPNCDRVVNNCELS